MVDFQSRETRRGLSDDEADEDADVEDVDDEPEAAEPDEEPTAGTSEAGGRDGETEAVLAVLAAGDASTDDSAAVADVLAAAGYAVRGRDRRARDLDAVQSAVDAYVDETDICAVVTVGGVGVGPTDRTVEAVSPLFAKALPGFGEAFRREWDGASEAAAVASRVTAGVADDTPVFCLPGEADAATFAARELVGPVAADVHSEATGE